MHPARLSLVISTVALLAIGCGRSVAPTAPGDRASDGAGALFTKPEAGDTRGRPERTAPTVLITSPTAHPFFPPVVSPGVTIQWRTVDADGPGPGVREYRYVVLHEGEDSFLQALLDPDAFADQNAPRFEEWTRVDGRVTSVELHDLPADEAIFIITGIDRRGGYDPEFRQGKNILFMYVDHSGAAATSGSPDDGTSDTRSRRGQ